MYCALIGVLLFILGTFGNLVCIAVFLRHKFRLRLITPYFIVALFADSIYLGLRLIKLFDFRKHYFSKYFHKSCSSNKIVIQFNRITSKFHDLFLPFVHFELYIRFSLILMAFLSIQRCVHVRQSIIVKKNIWSYIFIFTSFLLAYLFEFFGLTLFCSKENNRQLSRSWFEYTIKYLPNYTHLLTSKMLNDTLSYECVQQYIESNLTIMSNHSCTSDHFSTILGRYFDLHNSAIVRLIQLIHQHQTGQNLTRHEIRLAYQYHKCFIKFDSSVFLKNYKFLYDRKISLNRYTLLL
ncbi:unnamed protein product, partial [Didymodactylos carnosus]